MRSHASIPPQLVRHGRPLFLSTLVISTTALSAWTIFLEWKLPRTYVAEHWRLAWVGLDAVQVLALFTLIWAAWKRRMVFAFIAVATATMFLIDAWFDVTTARSGDFRQSVLEAFIVELPAALVLYRTAWVVIRRAQRSWYVAAFGTTAPSLWRLEVPSVDPVIAPSSDRG